MLWSRPGEPLIEHLRGVAALAASWAPDDLRQEAELAGLVHDLYKATPWFQAYLFADETERRALKRTHGRRLHHAFAGALFGAWVAHQRGLDAPAIFLAVARHHGHLATPTALLPDRYDPEVLKSGASPYAVVAEQTRALAQSEAAVALIEDLGLAKAFRTYQAGDLEAFAQRMRRSFRRHGDYWRTTRLFSLLIDADKRLAAGVRAAPRLPLPSHAAEQRVKALRDTSNLAPFRARLFAHVDAHVETAPLGDLFPAALTLTAPTGSGKTLTLFNFALKLRERLRKERGQEPRIIYALPFINLIEQNREVFAKALSEAGGDPKRLLLAHHHLSELGPEDELAPLEDTLLLAEAWEAEVVVTTFVQIAETLYGHRNRMLKKLHRLTGGSILLLDEVQAFPVEHWPLLRALLEEYIALGNTVVLATATQPALLPKARELAPSLAGYPVRVRIEAAPGPPQTPPEAPRLIVVNTITRSLQLYREQKALGWPVFYLSTNLTPRDREATLDEVKDALKAGVPFTLVATSIVEAGLDLDFYEAWRDLGPAEAVVQVAGRVNRSAQRPVGTLHLMPDEGTLGRVYGRVLSDVARKFFEQELPATDLELNAALGAYFDDIARRLTSDLARGFVEAKQRLRFCRRGYPEGCGACAPGQPDACDVCCFSLIQERLVRVPIFVEQDELASEVLDRLHAILELEDPHRRRTELRALRPHLNRYTINPIAHVAAKNLPSSTLFGREDYLLIPRDELDAFYDQETGFKWEIGFEDQFL